ncbi:MAG: OmpA family protein [Elusimicrobia bacterium]|nr:OmpA family protein [Elusimicrobiota bacterium]
MAIHRCRKEELEHELNRGALWAVTYGDLMSYLMIFFLILFSFAIAKGDKTKAKKYEESLSQIQKAFGGKADAKRLEKARLQAEEQDMESRLREKMDNQQLSKFVQIESNAKKIKLVLTDAILFDSGRAEVKENAKKVLADIAGELKNMPNEVVIEGHTDNVPIKSGRYTSNWELSMSRAYNVVAYMQQLGIAPQRLAGLGYGEYRPLTANTTLEERAKNRRIEISLTKTE